MAAFTRRGVAFFCFSVLCVPHLLGAAEFRFLGIWNHTAPPVTADIALGYGGVMVGRVSNTSADPMAGVVVRVQQGRREIARVMTSPDGFFSVPNLPGGTYAVTIGRTRYWYRCWEPGAAPAVCTSQIELVARDIDVGTYNIPWAPGSYVLYR